MIFCSLKLGLFLSCPKVAIRSSQDNFLRASTTSYILISYILALWILFKSYNKVYALVFFLYFFSFDNKVYWISMDKESIFLAIALDIPEESIPKSTTPVPGSVAERRVALFIKFTASSTSFSVTMLESFILAKD